MAGARLVVSERGDILSPKYAPESTAPATTGKGKLRPCPIPISATPIVPAVPQEVPVAMEVMEQMMSVAGRKMAGLNIFNP